MENHQQLKLMAHMREYCGLFWITSEKQFQEYSIILQAAEDQQLSHF